MNIYNVVVLLCAIVLNASANILLKLGIRNVSENVGLLKLLKAAFGNFYIYLGLFCFGMAFVAYILVLNKMKLSVAYPIMTSSGFVIVSIASVVLFGEHISVLKIVALAVIITGIWMLFLS